MSGTNAATTATSPAVATSPIATTATQPGSSTPAAARTSAPSCTACTCTAAPQKKNDRRCRRRKNKKKCCEPWWLKYMEDQEEVQKQSIVDYIRQTTQGDNLPVIHFPVPVPVPVQVPVEIPVPVNPLNPRTAVSCSRPCVQPQFVVRGHHHHIHHQHTRHPTSAAPIDEDTVVEAFEPQEKTASQLADTVDDLSFMLMICCVVFAIFIFSICLRRR